MLNRFISAKVICSILSFFFGSFVFGAISHASTLALGPLKLGMTNAEVAKIIALRDCHPESNQMECIGGLKTKSIDQDVRLSFKASTKRLTKISLYLTDWASDDPRLAGLYTELNFNVCGKEQQGEAPSWWVKEECFEAPDQVRSIRWNGGGSSRRSSYARSIRIVVEKNEGAYGRFVLEKKKQRLVDTQNAKNRSFSQGR